MIPTLKGRQFTELQGRNLRVEQRRTCVLFEIENFTNIQTNLFVGTGFYSIERVLLLSPRIAP